MENSKTSNHQSDKQFTLALIAFVMWVFLTGIILVHSILEFDISIFSCWMISSLLIYRTLNIYFFSSESNSKKWTANYTITLLLKSPFQSIL